MLPAFKGIMQVLESVESLSPEQIPSILAELESLRASLWRKMLMPQQEPVTLKGQLPSLLTVAEVAGALRFSRGHVYELIRCGQLQAVKKGRTVRVPAEALSEWQLQRRPSDSARRPLPPSSDKPKRNERRDKRPAS